MLGNLVLLLPIGDVKTRATRAVVQPGFLTYQVVNWVLFLCLGGQKYRLYLGL